MRINLRTPFAEKDAVKALGARWDPTKKLWYIENVADLTPFMRWMPDVETATDFSSGSTTIPPNTSAKPPAMPSAKGVITQSSKPVPHCGCTALPWEHCEHTTIG